MVSKPIIGSDGAASWQSFCRKKDGNDKNKNIISTAPSLPIKRADRLGTGMRSLQEEREYEERIQSEAGDVQMGKGIHSLSRVNQLRIFPLP